MAPPDRNPLARRLEARRAPIDYSQRSVKMKIFLLLALLLLVLMAAERARDPKTWQWLAAMDKWEDRSETVNNRLPPRPLRTAGDEADTFVTSDAAAAQPPEETTAEAPADPGGADPGGIDPVERAWEQGWKEVLQRLEDSQRMLLCEMLYRAERRQPLASEKHDAAAAAIEAAGRLWEDYQAAAFQSLVTLSPEDQVQWVDVLRQVNLRWSENIRPSLAAVALGRAPTENEEILLAGFQQTIDKLTLRRIEDDTLFLRPAEREIWLRLQARVRDTDPRTLRKQSLGQVGYLQLYRQPAEYRGRPVTIRGTVKHAYRAEASDNYLGVKEHFVLWLLPSGGPTSPIVVYALDVPPGFPAIGSGAGDMTKLHEDVEVTGFFLKRGAYLGKDGTYTAPLVLANLPQWHRSEVAMTDTARFSSGPTWLAPSVIAALVIAGLIFGVAWWRIRRDEAESHAIAAAASGPPNFDQIVLGASTHDALRDLEEQERRE